MRSTTGASGSGCSGFAISWPVELRLEHLLEVLPVLARQLLGLELSDEAVDDCCASPSSASFTSLLETASSISAWS